MRKLVLLMAVLAAPSLATAENDCGCFTPTSEQIADFESRITDLPEPIYGYSRYYSGRSFSPAAFEGKTIVRLRIEAQFVPLTAGGTSAFHVIEGKLPALRGEGCIAHLDVPPPDNVFQIFARCNRPGGWTPSAAEIADLERRLMLPQRAAPLTRYTRHYTGLTESGVRLIRGVFVELAGTQSGIIIESEVELPLVVEDGCSIIDVAFNSETKLGSARCSDTN